MYVCELVRTRLTEEVVKAGNVIKTKLQTKHFTVRMTKHTVIIQYLRYERRKKM